MPLSFGGCPPEPRLRSVAPTECPFIRRPPLSVRRSRCTPDLQPLRGVPTQPLSLRSPPMHFRSVTVHRASATSTNGPGTPGSLRPSLETTTGVAPTSGVLHLPASNITRCEQALSKRLNRRGAEPVDCVTPLVLSPLRVSLRAPCPCLHRVSTHDLSN
jgi:hypothetical protein